jgi:hypothetical protein
MTDQEWAVNRLEELSAMLPVGVTFDDTTLEYEMERTDLQGALSRMQRTKYGSGAWNAGYSRLHDWRNFRDGMIATRKGNQNLVAMYTQLRPK